MRSFKIQLMVALVSGELPLIPGTIMENITYGNNARPEEIERFRGFLPSKVWETPELLINGSETVITSGEARKIAFARALLRRPSVTGRLKIIDVFVSGLKNCNFTGSSVIIISRFNI